MNGTVESLKSTIPQLNEIVGQIKFNQENGWPDLEDKKKVFAYNYITSFDHSQAAEDSGYTRNQGRKLANEPLLKAFIAELRENQFARMEIKADYVEAMWLEALPILMGREEAIHRVKDGIYEGRLFDPNGTVAALKALNDYITKDTMKIGSEDNPIVSVQLSKEEYAEVRGKMLEHDDC